MSNSIKRYVLRPGKRLEPAGAHLPGGIFRAIKVTENNHMTIDDFVTGPFVQFKTEVNVSKSRHTTKTVVRVRTPQGWRTARPDADYIYRTAEGKFFVISATVFESLTRQTHVRIKP